MSIKGHNSIKILQKKKKKKMTGSKSKFSGNKILSSIKGCNPIKILRKMMGNNPKVELVKVDLHIKFGQILYIYSQNIEQKLSCGGTPK